jgi:tRNA threonylcarbamoyladenosine biosynthesis protein TsaB
MSLILNIETSIDVCSVALFDEVELIGLRENTDGKSHASLLTVFIEDLIKANKLTISQLSAVAVSMGPGSYTGLRIGVSAAKGLCYGSSIPLLAVNTLHIMVRAFLRKIEESGEQIPYNSVLCPMIDARRQEVYTALYNMNEEVVDTTKALIVDELTFKEKMDERKIFFFGNGACKYQEMIRHPNAIFTEGIYPSAIDMAKLSLEQYKSKEFQDTAYFEPYYLKDFVATIPKNKIVPLH